MGVCRICQGGGPTIFFWGGGGLATPGVAMRLLGGFGGMLPRKKFLNGAIWCLFGAYFHNFVTFKKSEKVIINCSHVLAM